MKKIIVLSSMFALLAASTALAVPVTNASLHSAAIGVGTKEAYIEYKVSPKAAIGYEYLDRDEQGHQNDIYGKYDLVGSNVMAVAGVRNHVSGDKTNFYGGLAVAGPSLLGWQPYASYVKGADFGEAQVGLNLNIIAGVGLNVNYHNFSPDQGNNEHGVGIGATFKF